MRKTLVLLCVLSMVACLASGASAHLTGKKICIDPGHGGSDPGASGFGLQEKTVVLDIGLRAKDLFIADNASVKLTRSTDVYVSISGRCAIANNWGANRFESVHCGSITVGTTTYCSPAATQTGGLDLRNKVHTEMRAHMGTLNGGLKTSSYGVLTGTNMPAILCDVACITNASDAAKLGDPTYRQEAARAFLHGTQSHYGVTPHNP